MDKYRINIDGEDIIYHKEGDLDMYYPKNDIGVCINYLGIHKTYLKSLNAKKFLGISSDKIEVYEDDMIYIETTKHVKATIENKELIPNSIVNKSFWTFSPKKGLYLSPIKTEHTIENITEYLDFVGYKLGRPFAYNLLNYDYISIINSIVVKEDKILINNIDINDCFLIRKVCNT